MAFSQFPPAASGSTDSAFAGPMAAMQTTYEHIQAFPAGIYDVEVVPSTTNCQVIFADATSVLTTVTTTSGTVAAQLNTPATKVYVTGLAGGTAGAVVKLTRSAAILTPDDIGNGTLDTINTTGTYNQTGVLSVLAFGGGAAGNQGGVGYGGAGSGGAPGGVALGVVITNAATTVTVGAKGVAANFNTAIVAPNQSSFGNLLTSSTNSFFYSANTSNIFSSFNGNSTTGRGGNGVGTAPYGSTPSGSQAGLGSGIGTGGTSAVAVGGSGANANPTVRGTAGTGKASGGGGGNNAGNNNSNANGRLGGDGADGVVYVLRGF
jgi:hypothetical protein